MAVFDVRKLMDTARQRTGLSDFGPDDFRDGLKAMVEGINSRD